MNWRGINRVSVAGTV